MIVTWGGERIELLPQRAAMWPAAATLLVADPHVGKDEAFRRAGVPVPDAVGASDLARLALLVARCRPRRLVVLGDLLHSPGAADEAALAAAAAWRRRHARLEIVNVRGNHDRSAGDPPAALDIACVDEPWDAGALELRHHPAPPRRRGAFAVAGHVHPAVRLVDEDGTSLRAPAFVVRDRCAILPAFGRFTGCAVVDVRRGDAVYAIGPDVVVAVSAPAGARA
jgi:DNA ligase-associated metallophosphoesterase